MGVELRSGAIASVELDAVDKPTASKTISAPSRTTSEPNSGPMAKRRSSRNPRARTYSSNQTFRQPRKALTVNARVKKSTRGASAPPALPSPKPAMLKQKFNYYGRNRKKFPFKSPLLKQAESSSQAMEPTSSLPTDSPSSPTRSLQYGPYMPNSKPPIMARSLAELPSRLPVLTPSSPEVLAILNSLQRPTLRALATRKKREILLLLEEARGMHAFDSIAFPSVAKAFEVVLTLPKVVTRNGDVVWNLGARSA